VTASSTRTWSSLSAAEARRLFEHYVAGHDDRVSQLLEEMRQSGGPVAALDFTRNSLETLWGWVTSRAQPPPTPVSDEVMRASGPPWWYEFHAPLGQWIGPDLARLTVGAAAYLAKTVVRQRPGSRWVLERDRGAADFNQPLLQVAGRGRFSPDLVVLTAASKWARGLPMSPARLREIYDVEAGPEPGNVRETSAERPPIAADGGSVGALPARPYSIERGAPGRFETVISFDDEAASDAPGGVERIEHLVASLAREPGVERVVHEDRELVLVRAPRLTDERLVELVDRHWDASG